MLSVMPYSGSMRRSPHGERGLKYESCLHLYHMSRRSPHGERGLKYNMVCVCRFCCPVALLMESVD